MWMMQVGGNSVMNMNDAVNLTKLSPTKPKPNTTCCNSYTHGTTLLGLNHHLDKGAEQNKREFNEQQMGSPRWSPTPEQLLALEEMYRRGTRTPTAEQIQQIAAHLRRFGKIEGKNVFYWFQNHKARERQKRRREVEINCKLQKHVAESLDKKESVLRRSALELEQTRNLKPPNCSKHLEGLNAMHKVTIAENRTHGWSQSEQRELQQRSSSLEKHATLPALDLSSSYPMHLINTMAKTPSKFLNLQRHNSLLKPNCNGENYTNRDAEIREIQTLQLFPLCSDHFNGFNCTQKDREVPITTINANFGPNQFFEFLPLKN